MSFGRATAQVSATPEDDAKTVPFGTPFDPSHSHGRVARSLFMAQSVDYRQKGEEESQTEGSIVDLQPTAASPRPTKHTRCGRLRPR